MRRWRVEYPGGPTWRARIVDTATGAAVPGVRSVRWMMDATALDGCPVVVLETTEGRLEGTPGAFECVVELHGTGGPDGE